MTDSPYEKWLAERRDVSPPATLADQIMTQVADLERQRRDLLWLRMVQLIERSRAARWAVCGGALAVGSLPFVVLVRAAQLASF
jgi:hypothetical protein